MSTPFTINFPSSLDDYTSLGGNAATPNTTTRLTSPLAPGATTANVISTLGFGANGKFSIGGEIIYFTDKTATTATGLLRGQEDTTDADHDEDDEVGVLITPRDHTVLVDAIIAIETAIDLPRIQYLEAQFDAASGTTPVNVTGLSFDLAADTRCAFEALLFIGADASGGSKVAIGGTCTAASIKYSVELVDDTTGTFKIPTVGLSSIVSTLGGAKGQAGVTSGVYRISGSILTDDAGTLTVQFSRYANTGVSSVLTESYFKRV